MRVYGNIMNRVMENCVPKEVKVGDGATICYHSDRAACTVIRVCTPNKIVIQRDEVKRTDTNGQSESQDYAYTPNANGQIYDVRRRKNGRWMVSKESSGVLIGTRDEYYDFGF